jgi:uncharacterized protein
MTATHLRQRLHAELPAAMRARDRTRVAVLRSTLAAIANAEAFDNGHTQPRVGTYANEAPRHHLDEGDVRHIVAVERGRLRALADEMAAIGQPDEAASLAAQAGVLDEHLAWVGDR